MHKQCSLFLGRIVIVSSIAHEFGSMNWDDINFEKSYSPTGAYGQSKLANVLHAKSLARKLKDQGIAVFSLHPGLMTKCHALLPLDTLKYIYFPGAIDSELGRHSTRFWWGRMYFCCFGRFLLTPEQGAQTSLYAALEPTLQSKSGAYFSDCKEARPQRKALIEKDQDRLWELSEKFVSRGEAWK